MTYRFVDTTLNHMKVSNTNLNEPIYFGLKNKSDSKVVIRNKAFNNPRHGHLRAL